MKIVLLYATGAFLSPEILYQEDKGALAINLGFGLHFPPANDCISILEQKCHCPQHPLSPQGFLQMLHEGVATILYPVTFCCF